MEVYSSPNNGISECGLLKHKRDDLHTLNNILPSNPEKCQNSSIKKPCEGMKHALMRNGECI